MPALPAIMRGGDREEIHASVQECRLDCEQKQSHGLDQAMADPAVQHPVAPAV